MSSYHPCQSSVSLVITDGGIIKHDDGGGDEKLVRREIKNSANNV
jgi:hypothetical protein